MISIKKINKYSHSNSLIFYCYLCSVYLIYNFFSFRILQCLFLILKKIRGNFSYKLFLKSLFLKF